MRRIIALTICAGVLAGCSNIATVNGVPVNRSATISTMDSQTYCEKNPAACIIGVAVGAGILGYIINEATDGGGAAAGGGGPGDDSGAV